jgi:hypothetical protein
MSDCPANLDIIEQIPIVRNRVQHPEQLTSIDIALSEKDLNMYPNPYFVKESESSLASEQETPSWLFPQTISPTKEKIVEAISNVEQLCTWLESQYCLGKHS